MKNRQTRIENIEKFLIFKYILLKLCIIMNCFDKRLVAISNLVHLMKERTEREFKTVFNNMHIWIHIVSLYIYIWPQGGFETLSKYQDDEM